MPLLAALLTGSLSWIALFLLFALFVEVVWIDSLYGSRYVSFGRTLRGQIEILVYAAQEVPGIGWLLRMLLSAREKSIEIEEGKAARQTAEQIVADFESIVFDTFHLEQYTTEYNRDQVINTILDQTELVKQTSYPLLAAAIFEEQDRTFRNGVLVAAFCREQKQMNQTDQEIIYTGERTSAFREAVKDALSDFDFKSPGDSERRLLQTFTALQPGIESNQLPGSVEIFQDCIDDPEGVFDHLTRHYTAIDFDITYGEDDWAHINSRILDVVYRGELNADRVRSDLDQIIQQEVDRLSAERKDRQAFLLCYKTIKKTDDGSFSGFQEKLKTQFQDWIYIGTKYASDDDLTNDRNRVEVSMHIVFPKKRYGSPAAFHAAAIAPIAPENLLVTPSELSVSPFHVGTDRKELYDMADEESDVDLIYDFTDYLVTQETERAIMAEALDNLINHRIDISELLRALPLNVFVPYITDKEETVFTRYQDTMERQLGINEFADWGNQDVDDVMQELQHADTEAVSDRWGRIAKDIVREVDRCTL